MKNFARLFLAVGLMAAAGSVQAQEAEFLRSLDGDWSGKGTVKVRADSAPINVTCTFDSDSTDTSLSLDGNCRGLVVISRAIGANIKAQGSTYSGSYTGAGTGTAGLNGKRSGNSIHLVISWAKEVNGDRRAQLTVKKVGENGMRLTTVDKDPKTGESVVTSQINLHRG